jgi:putative FmdB family regulatory protein
MPIYEYLCKKCGHRFERIQKFSDPEIRKCPECGGKVDKVLTAPAAHFKGEGWYVTDYARKGSKHSEGESPGSSQEKPDIKAEAKSESRPETKSEAKPEKKQKK